MDRKRSRRDEKAVVSENKRHKLPPPPPPVAASISQQEREKIIAQFYSKSKDCDDLGTLGIGEPSVVGIPNWRKVLSNFHPVSISIQHKIYPSLEHYFQASKALLCSTKPLYAAQFQSNGSIGVQSPLDAKRAGSKAAFGCVGAQLNADQWMQQRDKIMAQGLKARAQQDAQFRQVLRLTRQRDLYLLHFERSGRKSYWGGSIDKVTGKVHGTNRLGELLMVLRDVMAEQKEAAAAAIVDEEGASDERN